MVQDIEQTWRRRVLCNIQSGVRVKMPPKHSIYVRSDQRYSTNHMQSTLKRLQIESERSKLSQKSSNHSKREHYLISTGIQTIIIPKIDQQILCTIMKSTRQNRKYQSSSSETSSSNEYSNQTDDISNETSIATFKHDQICLSTNNSAIPLTSSDHHTVSKNTIQTPKSRCRRSNETYIQKQFDKISHLEQKTSQPAISYKSPSIQEQDTQTKNDSHIHHRKTRLHRSQEKKHRKLSELSISCEDQSKVLAQKNSQSISTDNGSKNIHRLFQGQNEIIREGIDQLLRYQNFAKSYQLQSNKVVHEFLMKSNISSTKSLHKLSIENEPHQNHKLN
ncbi:hypothetical protein I4U23_007682 [Adineta vaga]|nr:hypothetical protein I4U23_007682 [Adineta vaga]